MVDTNMTLWQIFGFVIYLLLQLGVLFLALSLTFKRRTRVRFKDAFKVWLYEVGINILAIIVLLVVGLTTNFVFLGVYN